MNTQPEDEISRSSIHVAFNLHRLGLLYEHSEPNGTAVSIFSAHTAHFHLQSSAALNCSHLLAGDTEAGRWPVPTPCSICIAGVRLGKGVDLSMQLTPDGPAYLPQPRWQLA